MKVILFIACLCISLKGFNEEITLDEKSLYLEAFGEEIGLTEAIYSLYIDQTKLTDIKITIDSGVYTISELESFKLDLKSIFKSEVIAPIEHLEEVNIHKLKEYKIDYTLKHDELALIIDSRPEQKKVLKDKFVNSRFNAVNTKNSWSLFTNHFYNYDINTNFFDYQGDFGLNSSSWTLEGNYSKFNKEDFRFEKLTLVKDFREPALRLEFGDISHHGLGVSRTTKGGGISFKRESSIRPDIKTRKNNEYKFFLEKAAWVKILINNKVYQKKYYMAGEHQISGFSLPRGFSQIKLEVQFQDGDEKVIEFGQSYDYSLLKKGYSDFQLSYLNDAFSLGKDYKSKELAQGLSLVNFSYGLFDNLTLSSQLSYKTDFQFLGLNAHYSSLLGNFDLSYGYSHQDKSERLNGHRFNLGWYYQYHNKSDLGFSGMNLNLGYQSNGFTPHYSDKSNDKFFWELDSNVQFRIKNQWNLNLSYQKKWGEIKREKFKLKIAKRLSSNFQGSVDLTHERFNSLDDDTSLALRFEYFGAKEPIDLNAQLYSSGDYSIGAGYESSSKIPGYGVDLNYNESDKISSLSLNSNYENPLFTSGTTLGWNEVSGKIESNLKLGHALSFVDGKAALSRPISGSFSILELEGFEKSKKLRINSDSQGGYLAKLGRLPSAIGNLTPYTINNFEVDNFDISPGEEIENRSSYVVPYYKSGNIIKIIRKSSFYVKAKLSYRDRALENVVIDVLDFNGNSITQAFSDELGEVLFEGLRDGSYLLDFGDYAPEKKIIIKGDGSEMLDLGIIILDK